MIYLRWFDAGFGVKGYEEVIGKILGRATFPATFRRFRMPGPTQRLPEAALQ